MTLALPNPVELDLMLTIDGVDAYKRYDCRTYVKCLDVAADAGWDQFHCNDCTAYVPIPKDDPSRRLFARYGERLFNGRNK
jgi:hypothetical protein